jgi:hypothetical protein
LRWWWAGWDEAAGVGLRRCVGVVGVEVAFGCELDQVVRRVDVPVGDGGVVGVGR